MSEFPRELIDRCAGTLDRYGEQYTSKEKAWAVLKSSGHAELVMALMLCRDHFSGQTLKMIDAALSRADAIYAL